MPKGILIAAPRSGAGKTTVTLGLVAALRRRGVPIRTAKSGPDYIDPAFHAAASGQPGVNLDSWAMPPPLLDALAYGPEHQLLVVESAMGLFDGVPAPPDRTGASADLAARLGLPVLLVLDISGQSQTAAAIALGMDRYRPGVHVAATILNRVASPRHRDQATEALQKAGFPVLGAIPRDPTLTLPERHLGLVQATEHADLATRLATLADLAERYLDIEAIQAAAAPLRPAPAHLDPTHLAPTHLAPTHPAPTPAQANPTPANPTPNHRLPPPGQRIALASDAAFTFTYPHLLAGWRDQGAEIHPFSPLADEPPPPGTDACWLPGGYPELHAPALAAATRFKAALSAFSGPVHGECGGFMVLGQCLQDAEGRHHPMAALLGHATSFARRRMTLGYRRATLLEASPLGPPGTTLRGHEFHYAQCTHPGNDAPLAEMQDGAGTPIGKAGARRGNVTGTFFHAIALE